MVSQTLTKNIDMRMDFDEISTYAESEKYTCKVNAEIAEFNYKYIIAFLNYFKNHPDEIKLIDNYLNAVFTFSKNIKEFLFVENYETYEKISLLIESSEISLNEGIEFDDLDLILDSFFSLESSLKSYQ